MKIEVIFLMVQVVNVLGQLGAFGEASGNHWGKKMFGERSEANLTEAACTASLPFGEGS